MFRVKELVRSSKSNYERKLHYNIGEGKSVDSISFDVKQKQKKIKWEIIEKTAVMLNSKVFVERNRKKINKLTGSISKCELEFKFLFPYFLFSSAHLAFHWTDQVYLVILRNSSTWDWAGTEWWTVWQMAFGKCW